MASSAVRKVVEKPKPYLVEDRTDIASKTVCLKISFESLGNSRRVNNTQVEVDADKALIAVNKTLLDSKELREIRNEDVQLRIWLQKMCLPLDIGIYFVPLGMVPMVTERLKKFQTEREARVNAFIAAYPGLCVEARSRLRGVFNENDYPNVKKIKSNFSFSFRYLSFGAPDLLKNISVEIFNQEKEKATALMQEAANEVQMLMRATLAELVKNLTSHLGDETGPPKRLRASMVNKLREFLDMFEMRNVVNDVELRNLVDKAKALLSGVSTEKLKEVDSLRLDVQKGMAKIYKELGKMVESRPTRKIKLSE